MNWGKRGGGGGGGGGDPMQMISILLMVVSLVIGLMGQCKEEEKKQEKDIYEGTKLLPSPTTETKSCQQLGGYPCNPFTQECRGSSLPANDNTMESVCYSEPARALGNASSGTGTQTCAAQQGNNCGLERYCPNNQWLPAKDTQTCCKTSCVARVQTLTSYPSLGEAVVERFDDWFGVWYGGDPQTQAFDANAGFRAIGHPNFARARSIAKNVYEFTAEGKTNKFTVTKNEAAEIAVQSG